MVALTNVPIECPRSGVGPVQIRLAIAQYTIESERKGTVMSDDNLTPFQVIIKYRDGRK